MRYARKGRQITAIADDQAWLDTVQAASACAAVAYRLRFLLISFNSDQPRNVASSSYCQPLSGLQWDVVIIDGKGQTFRERIPAIANPIP